MIIDQGIYNFTKFFNKISAKSFMNIGMWDWKIDNHNLVNTFNDILPLNLWSFVFSVIATIKINVETELRITSELQ